MNRSGRRPNRDFNLNGKGSAVNRSGRTRPQHYRPRKGRNVINAGTTTTGWSAAAGCTVGTASVTNPEGVAQTLVGAVGTADNTTAFFDCTTAPFNGNQLGRKGVEFDIYYAPGEPYAELTNSGTSVTLFFTDFTNSVAASFQIRQGWQRIKLKKADFSIVAGSGNWDTTAFSTMRFRLNLKANVTHTVRVRNLGYMGESRPRLNLQFDDIGASVYAVAFPLMKARGIVGTCAVISDAIDQLAWNGYDRMTVAQMREMKAAGWDFIIHSKSHQIDVLPTATQADCLTEIATCRDAIISNGLGNGISEKIMAAPYGEYGTNYWAAALEAGCVQFRGLVGDGGSTPCVAEGDVMYSPLVQTPGFTVDDGNAASLLTAQLDSLIGKGGSLTMIFHHIVTTPAANIEYSTANFTTFLDALVTRMDDIDVMNASDYYLQTQL